jgi:hypothetical protein
MVGAVMWRVVKSFFVHLPLLLLALLLIYFLCQGQDVLNFVVREQYRGASSRALLTVLGDARGDLMMWCTVAFAVSWLSSSLFLAAAERATPANEVEAGTKLGLWSFLLIVTIVIAVANGWRELARAQATLMSGTFLSVLVLTGLLVLAAYFLSTGLMVRRVMRPSVPLAAALPTRWS